MNKQKKTRNKSKEKQEGFKRYNKEKRRDRYLKMKEQLKAQKLEIVS